MTFLVYELAFNPEIQEKLVEEIKETDRKNDGKLDYTAIHEMTYLDMVLSGEQTNIDTVNADNVLELNKCSPFCRAAEIMDTGWFCGQDLYK